MDLKVKVRLHRVQAAFHHSKAIYRGFVGGRGAGKSTIGAYDLIRRAKAGRLYGAYAPTYPMMRDATLRAFLEQAEKLHFLADVNRSEMRATLGNGAEVLFRSLDDPEKARGPNLSGAWIDEASLCKREAFDIIIAALRGEGEQGWLTATFTPKGTQHWTFDVFGHPAANKDIALFRARTTDNPFLPATFYDAVRSQYSEKMVEQELEGAFIDIEGGAFQPDKVDLMFRPELGDWDGTDGQYLEAEPPQAGATYSTGADWARKRDWTEIVTVRLDCWPAKIVAFEKMRRLPWPVMVGKFDERLRRYPGDAAHDATGLGDVVSGYVTVEAEDVILVGRTRADTLSNWVNAVERGEVVAPFIRSLYNEHKFCSYEDLYGAGHPPDGVVACALAWRPMAEPAGAELVVVELPLMR